MEDELIGGEQPAEESRLYAGKYKTPDDLEQGYQEAQRAMNEAMQRAQRAEEASNRLAAQYAEAEQAWQAQQYQQPQYQAGGEDWMLQAEQAAWDEGDTARALQLRDQRTAQMITAAAQFLQQQQPLPQASTQDGALAYVINQEMRAKYGEEWDAGLGQEVSEYAQRNHWMIPPDLDPRQTIERLTEIANTVKGQKAQEQAAQFQSQQQRAAQEKRLAQSAFGGNGPLMAPESERDARIERFAALPRANSLLSS